MLCCVATNIFFSYRYIAEKTIQRGDDFMGRLFYPLRSIPNTGEEKTFVLYSHSGKTQHGYITLQLSIGAKQKRIPLEVLSYITSNNYDVIVPLFGIF